MSSYNSAGDSEYFVSEIKGRLIFLYVICYLVRILATRLNRIFYVIGIFAIPFQ